MFGGNPNTAVLYSTAQHKEPQKKVAKNLPRTGSITRYVLCTRLFRLLPPPPLPGFVPCWWSQFSFGKCFCSNDFPTWLMHLNLNCKRWTFTIYHYSLQTSKCTNPFFTCCFPFALLHTIGWRPEGHSSPSSSVKGNTHLLVWEVCLKSWMHARQMACKSKA